VRVVKTFTFYPVGPYVGWQYWTLPVEVTFYAVVAMLLLLDWFRYAEAFACVLGLASAGAWLGAALAMLIPGVAERHLIAALQGSKLAQLLLLRHGIFFALGMMMWIWTRAGGNRRRVAVIGCLIAAGMIQIVAEALKLSAILDQPISIALAIIVWLTGIAAIAASIRFAGHDHSIGLGRLFRILGVASFPLYLLHMPLGMMIAQGAAPVVGVVAAVVAGILAVILLSIVVALYIEPPVRGAMAVFLRRVETALVGWVPYVMRHSTPWCVHHGKPDVGATTMIMPSGRSRADESLMGSS
jgi:exopolysaccharide production protein ExoZ